MIAYVPNTPIAVKIAQIIKTKETDIFAAFDLDFLANRYAS